MWARIGSFHAVLGWKLMESPFKLTGDLGEVYACAVQYGGSRQGHRGGSPGEAGTDAPQPPILGVGVVNDKLCARNPVRDQSCLEGGAAGWQPCLRKSSATSAEATAK